jgi:chemotaxis protein methyltransferase CheR
MSQSEFVLFQQWVERTCSLSLGDEKKYLLETRLSRILAEYRCTSFADLYHRVERHPDPVLRDRIVDAVTTHETLWFRDETPWEALRQTILPHLARQAQERGEPARIWSAGCSTGQEPYSVAMLIDDLCRTELSQKFSPDLFRIVATDVSAPALMLAVAGRYDAISMGRGFSASFDSFRRTYFSNTPTVSTLSSEIRDRVIFKRHSLQDPLHELGFFDLVFMRYVTIYFATDFKHRLWPRVCAVMRPRGLLLLGAAETLLDHGTSLEIERVDRAYFYRNTSESTP